MVASLLGRTASRQLGRFSASCRGVEGGVGGAAADMARGDAGCRVCGVWLLEWWSLAGVACLSGGHAGARRAARVGFLLPDVRRARVWLRRRLAAPVCVECGRGPLTAARVPSFLCGGGWESARSGRGGTAEVSAAEAHDLLSGSSSVAGAVQSLDCGATRCLREGLPGAESLDGSHRVGYAIPSVR